MIEFVRPEESGMKVRKNPSRRGTKSRGRGPARLARQEARKGRRKRLAVVSDAPGPFSEITPADVVRWVQPPATRGERSANRRAKQYRRFTAWAFRSVASLRKKLERLEDMRKGITTREFQQWDTPQARGKVLSYRRLRHNACQHRARWVDSSQARTGDTHGFVLLRLRILLDGIDKTCDRLFVDDHPFGHAFGRDWRGHRDDDGIVRLYPERIAPQRPTSKWVPGSGRPEKPPVVVKRDRPRRRPRRHVEAKAPLGSCRFCGAVGLGKHNRGCKPT